MTRSGAPDLETLESRCRSIDRNYPGSDAAVFLGSLLASVKKTGAEGEWRTRILAEILDGELSEAEARLAQLDETLGGQNAAPASEAEWPGWTDRWVADARGGLRLDRGRVALRYRELHGRYAAKVAEGPRPPEPVMDLGDHETLASFLDAYRFLYRSNLRSLARGTVGELHRSLGALRAAIRSRDLPETRRAVGRCRSLLQPTRLFPPPQIQNGHISSATVDLEGIAHQELSLEVRVDGDLVPRFEALASDSEGRFVAREVPLPRGQSDVTIGPRALPQSLFKPSLLASIRPIRRILGFLGRRIDPYTRIPLADLEGDEIVRCKGACRNYFLRISWEEMGDRCCICGSGEFAEHSAPEFQD